MTIFTFTAALIRVHSLTQPSLLIPTELWLSFYHSQALTTEAFLPALPVVEAPWCGAVLTALLSVSLPHSIDCAGILKLRNSDIELRKGETDIGRKNTRVRVVFRVHIPQPNGKVLSLQASSIPVECCECPLLTRTLCIR